MKADSYGGHSTTIGHPILPARRDLWRRVHGGAVKDFAIELTDRPGELGRVATALSRYGVNLKAVTGLAIDHHVLVRIIADDPEAARLALQQAGIRYTEEEVVQVLLENRAGELTA